MSHEPIVGPSYGSAEWYEARKTCIGASESAVACGVSEERQPIDLYREKRGEVEPFDGNDYTRRGKRFEPFIAGEYEQRYGIDLDTQFPMFFHPDYPFIAATPDARRADKSEQLVEFKACNFRRAAQLGEEYSDEVFPDWAMQAQQQMFVMGCDVCELFVMVDLHTYKLFRVERNDRTIEAMVERLSDLWHRIKTGTPPPIDTHHPNAMALVRNLFGVESGRTVDLSEMAEQRWEEQADLAAKIKTFETVRESIRAEILLEMGTAAIGRLPGGHREITRIQIKECPMKFVKKAYVKLGERKVKS